LKPFFKESFLGKEKCRNESQSLYFALYMKRKLLIVSIWIGLGGGIALGGWVLSHFYILFPNSDQLFALRHNYLPTLVFHTDRYGYKEGEEVQLFASWRGGDSVLLTLTDILQKDTLYQTFIWIKHQKIEPGVAIHGSSWRPTYSFSIPPDLKTGWYVVGLQKGKDNFHQSIFIQPRQPHKKIAWLLSTHTWNAYNPWGGHSIYSKNPTDSVSFLRPQLLADPFIQNTYPNHQLFYQAANKDAYLAELLDTTGLDYDVYSMEDLESGNEALFSYDSWIISTHSEYWSRNMMENLNTYLDSGGSLINLAGNVAAYESFIDTEKRQLKVERAIENLWEERDSSGIRPFGMKPGFLGFHTYAPYKIMVDSSWLLEGTGLSRGDLIGEKSDTYDYTYMYGNWWERLWGLRKKGKMGAASGLEIDQIYEGTPQNWISVAAGLNPRIDGRGEVYPEAVSENWKTGEGGFIGYYEHPGGGIVVGVGSMAFTGALPYDQNLRQIVLNALEKSLNTKRKKSVSNDFKESKAKKRE